ncbi:prevent-host-death family protein [Alkalibacterium subtropicum]|uniref:Antitoxin n=1 Tax=Alkalibacterium subtropicum TaxID=753702 RepID=A0A1I1J8D1_9LACT|nr:type II toxin-antitoxin system Phd/YefM family antitoxin [Alkalibacterium subtropicum]SFC44371.1 prevent-host-death family protein [Alkalibacterium subtropicum]
MKTLDVKTRSVTEVKREFSKIVSEANETGEPTFVFNYNKPEAVIISVNVYEDLVKKNEELENRLFYAQLNARVNEGPGKLIPASEVLESEKDRNPFDAMTDEDLFD